jgi:hypothetical protein
MIKKKPNFLNIPPTNTERAAAPERTVASRLNVREIADDVGISIGSCLQIFSQKFQMRRGSAKFVIRQTVCARAQFSGCSSTTNSHSETGQMAACCKNLTLGSHSSRRALSDLVGALFKNSGHFLNRVVYQQRKISLLLHYVLLSHVLLRRSAMPFRKWLVTSRRNVTFLIALRIIRVIQQVFSERFLPTCQTSGHQATLHKI